MKDPLTGTGPVKRLLERSLHIGLDGRISLHLCPNIVQLKLIGYSYLHTHTQQIQRKIVKNHENQKIISYYLAKKNKKIHRYSQDLQ